jgi:L-ascorbate metabolism protein UlaG (beta-lactamase superfamily)
MKIKWYGHSCFSLQGIATTVILDPYGPRVGPLPTLSADVVAVTHDHYDHNYDEAVERPHELIKAIGQYIVKDTIITGYPTYHDQAKGADRGRNIVYLVEMDGARVAHLGDLGEPLPEDVAGFIHGVDVLMIPVGRNVTIELPEIKEAIAAVGAMVTIPMHYRTAASPPTTRMETIDGFCDSIGGCPEPIDELDLSDKTSGPGRIVRMKIASA